MSAADDIERMLDMVGQQQVRCPKCDSPDDLYVMWVQCYTQMVAAPLAGGLISGDTDNEEIDPVDEIRQEILGDQWIGCGNHRDDDDVVGYFHWFRNNTKVEYNPYLLSDLKGFS